MGLNDFTLIKLICENKCIWDTSNKNYNSREERNIAEKDIAEKLKLSCFYYNNIILNIINILNIIFIIIIIY